MTPQQAELAEKIGGFSAYKKFAVGDSSFAFFLGYEISQLLLSNLPGVLGFGSRALVYPHLFKSCGKRPAIGRGVVVRNPQVMSVGKKLLVDDYAVLDARGDNAAIELANYVSIGRFTTVAAKGGKISMADAVNIGSYCRIATQSKVEIGASVLIAAYCYIGPGNHQRGDENVPLIAREMEIKGGVTIGAHAWIGAHSTILDGVKIGEGAVVGAHSLVREDVPAKAVVAGSPARIIR